uniref:Uncharacterized protein n=1 Tax=Avena sativa TaxID=4498 RepID=A0ACD5ZEE3_AVESA
MGSTVPAVLVLRRLDAPFAAVLRRHFIVLDFFASGEPLPEFLAAAAAAPDPPRAVVVEGGAVTRVDALLLDAVPSLRCVVSTSTGVDHIDLDECARRGVAVTNAGKVYSTDAADHAVGLLLDVQRRVSAAERYVRRGCWPVQGDYRQLGSKLGGKRVGIIGLGNIGTLIARRLEAFGCLILYNSRRPKAAAARYTYFPDVRGLAAASDVLVVACGLTFETQHVVSRDALEALGKDGVLINIGRGANVDEAELVLALKEGKIAGAGLDVLEDEPSVPPDLLSMDNVVLTPHAAALTWESRSDLYAQTAGNLHAFFSGQPLLTPVLPVPCACLPSSELPA